MMFTTILTRLQPFNLVKNMFARCLTIGPGISSSQLFANIPKVRMGIVGPECIRTNVRNHFPRPSEYRRVKRHGYKHRMSTPGGRAILWRRLLKGRHVLSH